MMKRYVLTIVAVMAVLSVAAGNRSQRQMRAIAEQQLRGTMTRGGDALQLETIYQNEALAVLGDTAVGFAVVSRSDEQQPVLGVSKAAFSRNEAPEAYRWWLREMTRRLATGIPLKARSMTAVANFVKTKWDQSDPFNGMCPMDGTTRCPTGCVATAMAQVMKYYDYPAQGRGTGYYTVGDDEKEHKVSINSTYDWQNMHEAYKTGSGSVGSSAKRAVQQLMYDAGCAVGMNYTADGSGASDFFAAIAMFQNFRYDSLAIRYLYRGLYTDEEWEGMLYTELAQKNPILYGAFDAELEAGHAFLLTGYDEEGKVYVNWGWGRGIPGEGYDGYFELSGLVLQDTFNFDSDHDMVLGFRPQEQPVSSDEYFSLWVFTEPFQLKLVKPGKLLFGISGFYNQHVLDFQGILWYTFRNTANGRTITAPILDLETDVMPSGWGYFATKEEGGMMTDTLYMESFNPGTYEFTIASQARGEKVMSPMRTYGGPQYITIIKADDGTITVEGQELTAIAAPRRQEADGSGTAYDLSGQRRIGGSGIRIRDGQKFMQK